MKKYFYFFFIFLFLNIKQYKTSQIGKKKNILVIIFPGGKNKNIYMKELFDFSINNNNEYDFYYDIIIHNSEKKIWEQNLINDKNKNKYTLYDYGSISDAIEKYDIDDLPKQNLFKFYQIKLRLYNQDFLDSGIINTLKESKIKYSLLITDQPNYISILCAKELSINNKMYLSMRPLPQLFYREKQFLNPSFIPSLGSEFTNLLTFKERCTNFYNYLSDKILNFLSNYEIKYLYNVYDYSYINTNNYFCQNTLILIQYPIFFTYPLTFSPHIIPFNPVSLPYNHILNNFDNKINSTIINEFINANKNNIIVSKEIFHQLEIDTLLKIILKMKDIGFIYLYEKEEKIPKNKINNLLILDYQKYGFNTYEKALYYLLNKNNIFGMITNSNFNEIMVSIYYSKPVISFGSGIYQQNINAYIIKNSVGVVINRNNINNYSSYIEAIKKIKKEDDDEFEEINNIYLKQSKKLSELLKLCNHPGIEYNKWVTYGMKNEYEDLKILFYEKHNWFVINNFDIIIISFIIIFIFLFSIFIFCKKIMCPFCCCCEQSSSKIKKIKNVEKKVKKD